MLAKSSRSRPQTEAELQASWGIRPAVPAVKIRRFAPFRNQAGTVRGYIDIELPSGLIINGMKLMIGSKGGYWLAMPAEKALDKSGNAILDAKGKQVWNNHNDFRDQSTRERFRDQVLAALRHAHPDACDRGGT
jgi:DNA-binding cell septation regulator SpoVG